MIFKHQHLKDEFLNSDPRLQIVLHSLDSFMLFHGMEELTITSIYRDEEGSTHKYMRAGDGRIQPDGGKILYTYEELKLIQDHLDRFIYDSDRPHLNSYRIHPNKAGTGLHLHVQVSYYEHTTIIKEKGHPTN